MKGMAFDPAKLSIPVGTHVIFESQDNYPHTATADDGSGLASTVLTKGQTFEYAFDKAGTYRYHCEPHPWMTAEIEVK